MKTEKHKSNDFCFFPLAPPHLVGLPRAPSNKRGHLKGHEGRKLLGFSKNLKTTDRRTMTGKQ